MPQTDGIQLENPELTMLQNNKLSGYNYRQRRQENWMLNYTLYRDAALFNRLIQRQSVHLPLMKQTIRTLLKDVDDMPVILYENLDNDKDKEVFQNEYWKWTLEQNNAELQDITDKRQVLFFGRTFDQWQIVNGKIVWTITDPEDILVDRYMNPTNIDSSRYLIHTHIFRPLSSLESNPYYDQKAVARLKEYYATEQGLIKAKDNAEMLVQKNTRMQQLGVADVESPILGETYVELSQHFVYHKEPGDQDEQIYLYVECDDMEIILKKPQVDIIGPTKDDYWTNHYSYETWADDADMQDFWTDGVADVVRPANQIVDVWFSQLVENRTLRSFGMHYFDSSLEGFVPQTFEPKPWGWYGVPVPQGGNLAQVFQKVDVPDLSESLDEMNFILEMNERATGSTATQQGVQTERSITLGEVKLALGQAQERVKGMSKFYTPAWKRRGEKFLKLIEAAPEKLDAVKLYKKGRNSTDIYSQTVKPTDWMSESGYVTRVWSQDEKNTQDSQQLEKLSATRSFMPGNAKLDEIVDRKALEFAGLTPDEINSVMEIEKQKIDAALALQQQVGGGLMPLANPLAGGGAPTPGGTPGVAPVPTPQPQPAPMRLGG